MVSERKASSLLRLLRRVDVHSIFTSLPMDVRSLRPKFNADVKYRAMSPGEYAYIGVYIPLNFITTSLYFSP